MFRMIQAAILFVLVIVPAALGDDDSKAVEAIRKLTEKGRDQFKAGDFELAEKTWLKAIEECGAPREEQIRKGELYLRIGIAKETASGSKQGTERFHQRFNDIMAELNVSDQERSRRWFAVMEDVDNLWREYIKNRKKPG